MVDVHDTNIRVGLFLTNQHQPGVDLVEAQRGQIAMAERAVAYGWDSLWSGHHYLPDGMAMMQPVPFLARLTALSEDVTIGIGILLLALHNPVHVAETFATLDVLASGRLVFGVGLGYREAEYAAFGLKRSQGVARLEANLHVIRELWTGNEVSVNLPWCKLDDPRLTCLPIQRPGPPVWMAANSDAAVLRAARLSDAWLINPHATTSTIRRQLDLFDHERSAQGRPRGERPLMREVFCGPSRDAALAAAGPYLSNKYQVYSDWGQDKVMPVVESFDAPFDELEHERFLVGSPDDILAGLLPWRDEVGVDHFIFRTHWAGMSADAAISSIDLLAREVVPALCS